MSKTIANLYKHAIATRQLAISEDPDLIVRQLNSHPVGTVKQLIKKYNVSQEKLESYCHSFYSSYISFVIIGCPHSTDIDVVCIVDHSSQQQGKTNPLFTKEIERLNREIYDDLGYDKTKSLDINLISIKKNNITSLLKGGRETQNMILATYSLHKQKYPCPNLDFVQIDILERCRAIAKFYLDNLENIAINYDQIRESKKQAYASTHDMLEYSKILIGYIDLDNIHCTIKWRDAMKSLTVKFIQLILLTHNIYSYTKHEMIDRVSDFGYDRDGLLWYLFRGRQGAENKQLFIDLHNNYVTILNKYFSEIKTTLTEINFDNIDRTYHDKFLHFFNSPNIGTIEFEQNWNETYGEDVSVNLMFESESSNEAERQILLNMFESKFHANFIWTNQRSNEWIQMLKFYVCGNNSAEIPSGFAGKFNLIRGAIAETLIADNLVFEDFNKISLGLLVFDNVQGSKGCAPDLILVNGKEIIPVEIKCLRGPTKNSDYYGSFDLAQKQCDTVKNILDSFQSGYIKRKLIILSWFEDNKLVYECLEKIF